MARLWLASIVLAGCSSVFGLDPIEGVEGPADGPAPGTWAEVAVGSAHTCAIEMDGALWCWGTNDDGQLGLGLDATAATPARVGTATWTTIAASGTLTCGIQTDASLWCWGPNVHGQVGDGTYEDRAVPTQVLGTWQSVSTGGDHACAITLDGAIGCWGNNGGGQLGDGTVVTSPVPLKIDFASTWLSVGVGKQHTCALAADSSAWCWGLGYSGQLGNGGVATTSGTPVLVGIQTYAELAVGGNHACGRRPDSGLECWGINTNGQLGDSTVSSSLNPQRLIDGVDGWTNVVAGAAHTCGVKDDGSLWCWGNNDSGQVGDDTASAYNPMPRKVDVSTASWARVAGGERSTCGVTAEHNLWCWGATGAAAQLSVPTPSQLPGTWRTVKPGGLSTCGIAEDGSLACWGSNTQGQLGDGTHRARSVPTTIAAGPWQTVDVSLSSACALDDSGTAWCWGQSYYGLGDGSTSRLVPTPVTPRKYSDIIVGYYQTYGIEIGTGHLWCWGYNYDGSCGVGDTALITTPRQVGTDAWSYVTAGTFHACGRTTGGLHCWGQDTYGQLGDGVVGPTQMSPAPLTTPAALVNSVPSGMGYSTCAIEAGVIYCWGYNYNGELGRGTPTTQELVPAAIAGTWKAMADTAGGVYTMCAIATDDTLWCWGSNVAGQVGNGTFENQPAPVQIDSNPVWTEVSVGARHACALRTDKTAWCWGANDYGQLGVGVAANPGEPRLILIE